MLRTQSIKSEPGPRDGTRISIMSRHTLSDGITPDPEITPELYDEWWPELAPPAKLVGTYYKQEMTWKAWKELEAGYKDHLKQPSTASKVAELINLAGNGVVTVLCIEETPDRCHRRLLAEECQLIEPNLEVEIN